MKLKNLSIGAKVKDSKSEIIFLVAAQNHPNYKGTTLLSEKIIEVGCLDGAEPLRKVKGVFEQAGVYGWNEYKSSNIHQWLNSESKEWYKKSHENDTPPDAEYCRYGDYPYLDRSGFLSEFSEYFKAALCEVDVPYVKREKKEHGALSYVKTKVFLPSRTEVGKGDEWKCKEGDMFPLFYDYSIYKAKPTDQCCSKYGRALNPGREDAPYDDPQIYDPKFGWWYWLRTANMCYDFLNRVASPYGALSYTYSNNDSVGIRPVLNLDSDVEVVSNNRFLEVFTLVSP